MGKAMHQGKAGLSHAACRATQASRAMSCTSCEPRSGPRRPTQLLLTRRHASCRRSLPPRDASRLQCYRLADVTHVAPAFQLMP